MGNCCSSRKNENSEYIIKDILKNRKSIPKNIVKKNLINNNYFSNNIKTCIPCSSL